MNLSLPLIVAGLSATAGGIAALGGGECTTPCQTAATCVQTTAPAGCCAPKAGAVRARAVAPRGAVAITVPQAAPPAVSVQPLPAVPAVAGSSAAVPVAPVAPVAPAAPVPPMAWVQGAEARAHGESHWRQGAEEAIERAREALRSALRRGERSEDGREWRGELERALQELERVRTQEFARVEREIERATREAQREIERAAREAQRAGELARTRAPAGVQSLRGALGGLLGRAPQASQRERSLEERVAELERRLEMRGGAFGTAPRDDRDCTPSRARVLVAPPARTAPRSFGYVIRVGPDGEVSTEGLDAAAFDSEGWREELEDAVEEAWEEAQDAMEEVQEAWEDAFDDDEEPAEFDAPESGHPREVVYLAPDGAATEHSELDRVYLGELHAEDASVPVRDLVALDPEGLDALMLLGDVAPSEEAARADADALRALIADMTSEVAALRAELDALREDLAERRARGSLR